MTTVYHVITYLTEKDTLERKKALDDLAGLGLFNSYNTNADFTNESRVKDRIENALLQSFGDNGDTFTFTKAEVLGCTVQA